MKIAGVVLVILGGLMILSSLKLAFTQYDLGSSHDQSKFFGGLGVCALILLGGVALIKKSSARR